MKKLLLLFAFAAGTGAATVSKATIHTVGVANFAFTPSTLTLCLGDTIDFIWGGGFHNVHITAPVDVTSPDLQNPGDKFRYIPTVGGVHQYQCDYHLGMGMAGTFTVRMAPTLALPLITNVSCNGGNNGSINITLTGGTPPVTYLWSNAETTEDVTGLSPNTYSVTATNMCGADTILGMVVTEPAVLSVTLTPTQVLCAGGNNGAIDLSLSGGTAPYTYAWSNSATTQDITGLTANNYTVTVTDSKGCTATGAKIISEPPLLDISVDAVGNASNCSSADGTVDISVSGGTLPYDYNWMPGSLTTEDITGLNPGTYTITVTDANNCTAVATATVSNANPTIVMLGPDVTVCGGPALLDAGAGYAQYTWSTGAFTQTIPATTSGTYYVEVKDGNGCTASDTVKVTINTEPVVSLGADATVCGSMVLNAGNPGSTYAWSPAGTTQMITALSTGTYSVLVTDANGCTGTDDIVVTVNTSPVVNLGADVTQCGGSVVLDAGNPGDSYAWSPAGTTQQITALSTGTYSVVVTDGNNCTGSDAIQVTIGTNPVVNLGADATVCGSAVLNAGNPGATYAWSPSGTTQMITALATNTYSVLVTDVNGCTGTDLINLVVNPNPVVNLGADVTQCGGNVVLDAGNAGATYAWSPAGTTQQVTALASGTYSVIVTDANNCTAGDAVNITIDAMPDANLGPDVTQCGGSVTLNAGNAGASYLWSDNSTNQTLVVSSTGTYSVVVTNSCGNDKDTVMVTINPGVTVSLGADVTQCGGTVMLDAGNPGSSYQWSTSASTQQITVSATGTYSVVVTNGSGCSGTDTVTITINALPVISAGSNQVICPGTPAILTATGGVSYSWLPGGQTTASISVSPTVTTTYSVIGTAANGCTAVSSAQVSMSATQSPPLVEGIENPGFPPAGWVRNNPDAAITWERTTLAAKTGVASMYMDNFDYAANGEIDEMVSPAIDLSGASGPVLTFQVAYQLYTDPGSVPNYSDTLMVQTSTDCGATWNTVYTNFGTALTTVVPNFSTNEFIPGPSDWRMETVNLPVAPSVMVKFRHSSDYENNMYIDDINITAVVAATETSLDEYISVYPNPTHGQVFVRVNVKDLGRTEVKFFNVAGDVVKSSSEDIVSPQRLSFDLTGLPGGIYFVEVSAETSKTVKKIILTK